MSFRTKLFEALQVADLISCNGQRVVAKMLQSPQGLLHPYVDLADGTTVYLEDAEIQLDDEGLAYGTARGGGEALTWRFSIVRALAASDVPVLQMNRPNVHQVIGRLKQLGR